MLSISSALIAHTWNITIISIYFHNYIALLVINVTVNVTGKW